MTTPQPNPTDDLEAVARIIDPKGWETRDAQYRDIKRSTMHDKDRPLAFANADYYTRDSREKAAAILAALRAHVEAIQAAKSRSDAGKAVSSAPILDCVNDLPAIIRQLDAAELEIEAEFERYEDATPAHPDAALMERVRTVLGRAKVALPSPSARTGKFAEIRSEIAALLSDLKAEAGR